MPVLYSSPLGTNSKYEYGLVDSSDELKVYAGIGVLGYPWPGGGGDKDTCTYYRQLHRFFGSFEFVEYDRGSCRPLVNFASWPCPHAFPQTGTAESLIRR